MKVLPPLLTRTLGALLIALSSLPVRALEAPALAPAKPEKKPGLSVTFTAGGHSDTRPARLVALFVPAGQAPTPFLAPGPFTARWEGDILSELRSSATFTAETTGAVKVTLNGQAIYDSRLKMVPQPVQLQKGSNAFVVDFESPAQGDAMVRLLWSSKDFPPEPVAPAIFQHDVNADPLRTGERLREGRLLFAQNRCSACHEGAALLPAKGEGMPELAQDAPVFDAIGEKYQEPWLAAWINDPHSIRPHALMPKLFAGEVGKIDQRAADLAAFFVSTGAPKESKAIDDSLAAPGGALFANLGCIACHTRPDADGADEHDRVPLAQVKAKWNPAALTEYLLDPAKSFPGTRMPNFRLTAVEADQLTAYLLSTATKEFPPGPKGDPTRGAQLLATSGCLNCHAGVPPTTTPTLTATLEKGWSKGCLAATAADRGSAPDFGFTPAQRTALVAFGANGFDSLKHDPAAEFAERQIQNLRCTACHARDGQPGIWSQLEEEVSGLQSAAPLEEGEGKPIATTAPPALTWLGEKLRPDYLAAFIAGHAKDKPRPWIVARMPGFTGPAELLAQGLPQSHGFSTTLAPEQALVPEKVEAGKTLIGENGGFNCVQCHTLADRPATAVFEAPGPNLALAPQRLRREYFHRWVLTPTRIDPDTKMPKFADEEGKTPLTDFFGGQASEQFDAIWQYLQSLQK